MIGMLSFIFKCIHILFGQLFENLFNAYFFLLYFAKNINDSSTFTRISSLGTYIYLHLCDCIYYTVENVGILCASPNDILQYDVKILI